MSVAHSQLIADTIAANDRGDSITLEPYTNDAKTICGIFSYETIDSTGVEARNPVIRIAACESGYVSHGTKVKLTSRIHNLNKIQAEVKAVEYRDSGTVNLYLLANV